ncbi:MAG: phosphodiester glycosidase family protein [Bacillota bacterium]|nr:phosphodiester glycosidase family protein [Bacillota bacterium]
MKPSDKGYAESNNGTNTLNRDKEYYGGSLFTDEPGEDFTRVWNEVHDGAGDVYSEKRTAEAVSREIADIMGRLDTGKSNEKRRTGRGIVKKLCSLLIIFSALYCTAVFSDIPFLAKWRTIYIETAMTTKNHQWLATAFIPKFVIDRVTESSDEIQEQQYGISSHWGAGSFHERDLYHQWKKEKGKFAAFFSEIDQNSFNDFMKEHPDEFINEKKYLVIDKAGLNDGGTPIKTVFGDQVLAIDTENAITIIKVEGDGYVGRLAIVKDPSRVGLGLSRNFDERGATIGDIAEYNNAVLAINASGFYDPNGKGDGGNAYGLVISKGKILKKALGYSFKTIALDESNRLNVGNFKNLSKFRDAAEFKPALIIDGEVLVSGSAGWGIQPRSAIGQSKKGEILLLIVDGRAPGYSIGCTVGELASIMKRYGAYEACNLDGGSSSLMYYNGREISKPSAANKVNGRNVPNGFVVYGR